MEMDREDGTEFDVDVNENRAEGCRTHTHRPLDQTGCVHRNCVFTAGPKHTVNSGPNRVTSEEINGFPEPDGVIELNLEPTDGELKPGTSGHIRTPGGETGCSGEIDPNFNPNRTLDGSGAHLTTSGLINSVHGGEVDFCGFHASPVVSEGTAGVGGNVGSMITSGETSDTRGTHSSWAVTGEAARVDEANGNPPASRTMYTSDGGDEDIWEFHGNRATSGEITTTRWTCVSPGALVETSGTRGSDAVAQTTVSMRGTDAIPTTSGACANMSTCEETTDNSRTCSRLIVAGEMMDIGGTTGDLTASGERDGTRCSQVSSVVEEETSQTRETNASPRVANEMVDLGGTSASLSTCGETAGTRRTSASPMVTAEDRLGTCENDTSLSVAGETVSIGGNHGHLTASGETAGSTRTNPGPFVAGIVGSLTSLDVTTAATVTGEPVSMRETGVSQVADGPIDTVPLVDGALPRDQVSGNSQLGNDETKTKFAIWENPDGQVRPRVRVGKRPSSCCTELEMKIPNGDVNSGELQIDKIQREGTFTNEALDKGVRVGNCGYLVINRRTVSGTSSIPVYSRREPWSAADRKQEVRSISDLGPETKPKLSKANVNEDASNQEIETRPEYDVRFSDGVVVARPRTLRTNPGQAVSLSCDSTPLNDDNAGYFVDDGDMDVIMNSLELGRRQSAPDKLQQSVDPEPSAERTANKRHGLAGFLTRSLFSWKPRETKATAAASGWRLFGKISPTENDTKDSRIPQQPEQARRKNLEFEPLSTSGLILEDRPANLPAKSEEEAQRHRQQYSEMMAGAKRRELKEAQRKKKQTKERHRQEESIARALVVWNTEILPNWENMRNTRRVRELWWQGLPPSIRGKIWSLAIGNELNITPELYEIFLSRAKEKWRSFDETGSLSESEDCGVDKESSLDLIKLDIFRTFPSLYIFQKGGPYHDVLHNVLGAYTCYRPDVGYVQGMSFIAAVLILNHEEADAFIAFANLLNKPCQIAFFRVDHDLMLKYFAAFEVFFEENLPKLFQHFQSNSLTPDFYLIDWIFTLYSKPLPLDVACRVWDLFCRDGEEALFRTALGILRLHQDVLLQMDFIHSAQFLSRLPQNTPAHTLFTCIANTHMLSNNRRWNQVFSALMKDGPKEADKTGSPALRS